VIGDGSALNGLKEKVMQMRLENKVIFHGFKQKEELPEFLAMTDVFAFQTGFDIWGLVLNEAMAAGLTCIASPEAGAVDDLIEDGKTGFVCNFADTKKAADLIDHLLDQPAKRNQIGSNAAHFIEEHATISKSASGFIHAINSVK
jgi:glycosyltransferase involved in cell wall biosynthesis